MQNKNYCIISGKKIRGLTKNSADFPKLAGTLTIPKRLFTSAVSFVKLGILNLIVSLVGVEWRGER